MPQEALDGSSIELTGGVPRFRYTNFVGICWVVALPKGSEEVERHVFVIILSLRLVEDSLGGFRVASDSGQVLPDCATLNTQRAN